MLRRRVDVRGAGLRKRPSVRSVRGRFENRRGFRVRRCGRSNLHAAKPERKRMCLGRCGPHGHAGAARGVYVANDRADPAYGRLETSVRGRGRCASNSRYADHEFGRQSNFRRRANRCESRRSGELERPYPQRRQKRTAAASASERQRNGRCRPQDRRVHRAICARSLAVAVAAGGTTIPSAGASTAAIAVTGGCCALSAAAVPAAHTMRTQRCIGSMISANPRA